MKKETIKSILSKASFFALAALLGLACLKVCDARYAQMEKYAAAHDCKWVYNDMCYTYEQRGYLWPERCAADAECAEKWGL